MSHNRNHPDSIHDLHDLSVPEIEAAVIRALSRKPAVAVPDGFAAAITRRALDQPQPSRSRWLGWGPRVALASAALLTAGMFALAPHAAPSLSNVPFDGELILLAELGGLLLFSHQLLARE